MTCESRSRLAIPRLAAWLQRRWGVTFQFGAAAVLSAEPPSLQTSRGQVEAEAVIVCPGTTPGDPLPRPHRRPPGQPLHMSMLRLADPGFRLPGTIMSDLGLVRYPGYAALPEAAALRAGAGAEATPRPWPLACT